MPPPDGPESGIRSPYSNRVGIDLPQFRGMNRDDDPGAIDDAEFWLLQNCKLDGAGVKNRDGLSEVFTNAMGSCLYGIWDDRNPADDEGNTVFSAGRWGYSPQSWDQNYDASQEACFPGLAATFHGQRIVVSDATAGNPGIGYSFSYTTTAAGVPTFVTAALFTFASALPFGSAVKAIVEWDGAVWFAYSDTTTTPSNMEIWKWSGGATASLEHTFTALGDAGVVTLGVSDSDLYVATPSSATAGVGIIKRNDGAWTSLDMTPVTTTYANWYPAGFTGYFRPPYLYFSGAGPTTQVIVRVQGSTVAIANDVVPASTLSGTTLSGIVELNGYLYVVGATVSGTDSLSLYQLNGADSASAVANLTAQTGILPSSDGTFLAQILQWRNQLFVDGGELIVSNVANPTVWADAAVSVWQTVGYQSGGRNTFSG